MTNIARQKIFFLLITFSVLSFCVGVHAQTECNGLAKVLGQPPAAVTGSLQGTRCGNWHGIAANGNIWNIPFMLEVKGQSVRYVVYWMQAPVVITPQAKWDGASLSFDIPLGDVTGNTFAGNVHYSFKVLANGDIEPTSVSSPDGAAPISFVSQPKFAPYTASK